MSTKTLSVGDAASVQSLPRGEIFDVLSNERRQCVLHYLKEQGDRPVELGELVDHVAAWENDTSLDQVGSAERKRVYTALRQSHLPRLEEAGIVAYDDHDGTVELTDDAREVQLYLEFVPVDHIPWSEYYLALSLVCAALLTVTWAGVYPFGDLSALGLGTIIVALFTVSSVVHTYESATNRIGSDRLGVGE